MARSLRVVVTDQRGKQLRLSGLTRWLAKVAPARARGTLAIALVSDDRMRALNQTYRRCDYATDVLSFPAFAPGTSGGASARQAPAYLGDIVIAKGVARRQAREAGHRFADELRILTLHGLLHLLGYDHEHDRGTMARVERKLRRKGGLRHSLLERSLSSSRPKK